MKRLVIFSDIILIKINCGNCVLLPAVASLAGHLKFSRVLLMCIVTEGLDDLPVKPKPEWVHMDKVEYEKIAWMKDLPPPSTDDQKVCCLH